MSPEEDVRNQGQEKSRQSEKTRGNMGSVCPELWQSLTESRMNCLLAAEVHGLHSTADQESENCHWSWDTPSAFFGVYVCVFKGLEVLKKEFPSLFLCRKNMLHFPFLLISHQSLFSLLIPVLQELRRLLRTGHVQRGGEAFLPGWPSYRI